jgi:hypothetical protein
MARKFKAIRMIDLAQMIPEWKELGQAGSKSPLDLEITAKMLETLDAYAEQNGMQFFQWHQRRVDNSLIAIFVLKD